MNPNKILKAVFQPSRLSPFSRLTLSNLSFPSLYTYVSSYYSNPIKSKVLNVRIYFHIQEDLLYRSQKP